MITEEKSTSILQPNTNSAQKDHISAKTFRHNQKSPNLLVLSCSDYISKPSLWAAGSLEFKTGKCMYTLNISSAFERIEGKSHAESL